MSNAVKRPSVTSFQLERPQPVRLTENQRKVIEDKYLKSSPSIEAWLITVARNIAYAELLHHPASHQWGLFDGVRVARREIQGPAGTALTRNWLLHQGLTSSTEREQNFRRFIDNCAAAIEKHKEAKLLVSEWESNFYNLMSTWRFLPNSPTLMNAGRDLQQLSACYVLPVDDSMEGVTHALQAQALIHKSGGGTGFSFERMRPAGDTVKSTDGVASGVLPFMQVFDRMTAVVKQGGNRRGANMGILNARHPEIREFVRMKTRPGVMENFNLSVSVDADFWEALEHGWEYELINPRNGQSTGRVSARELFDTITESAWKSGDPGILFADKINSPSSNPTPQLGRIEATNPCGEQPLLPNEACNLGSLNLSLFVIDKDTGAAPSGTVNWDELKTAVAHAVRFLDNVIDMNNYPLPEIEIMAKGNRRIGLGLMGWAEALVKMGIAYDSEEAIALAGTLMNFINQTALEASEELARERGVFPNWKNSVFDPQGSHFSGESQNPRNCARTTIAPTGTIGLAAGLQGAGIEPFFALAYTRYNARALDAVRAGAAPDPRDVFIEVNPLFRKVCEKNAYFGLTEEALWKKIEANKKSARGIPEIPAEIQALFPTSHDISPEFHVRIQAAFQKHTDNAVSKTVNLPSSATVQDVKKIYKLAHDLGCKGVTIYRDGSRRQQVLNLATDARKSRTRDLSAGVSSEYYEIKTGHGPLHVHFEYDEEGPYRVFASLAPLGTEISGLTSLIGILISKYLEQNGDPGQLIKHLQSVKGDRPFGLGDARVNSIAHGIAVALKAHLKKHGWTETNSGEEGDLFRRDLPRAENAAEPAPLELWNLASVSDQCPECYSSNIRFGAGCTGPACNDCGYSECN